MTRRYPTGPPRLSDHRAPRAGTTALHAALARHPDVFMTDPKEPNTGLRRRTSPGLARAGRPPLPAGVGLAARGLRAAVRRRARGQRAARAALLPVEPGRPPPHRRAAARGQAGRGGPRPDRPRLQQLDAPVVRRARAGRGLRGGLRPRARADRRGWAPFWRYSDWAVRRAARPPASATGPGRVLVLRYRDIVDDPTATVDRACGSWESLPGRWRDPARQRAQLRRFPGPGPKCARPGGPGRRLGGPFAPPQVWRKRQRPAGRPALGPRRPARPPLSPEVRARLMPKFADDVRAALAVTGESFDDWLSTQSRGSFKERSRDLSGPCHQVVRPVVAGRLDVVAGAAVGKPHRGRVPERAVRVRGRIGPTVGAAHQSGPLPPATPVVSYQLDMASARPSYRTFSEPCRSPGDPPPRSSHSPGRPRAPRRGRSRPARPR